MGSKPRFRNNGTSAAIFQGILCCGNGGRHEIWGVLTTLFDKEVVHSHVPWASDDCNARQKHKKWWKWRFEHVPVEVLASIFGIALCPLNYALISIASIYRFIFEVCFTFSQPIDVDHILFSWSQLVDVGDSAEWVSAWDPTGWTGLSEG